MSVSAPTDLSIARVKLYASLISLQIRRYVYDRLSLELISVIQF